MVLVLAEGEVCALAPLFYETRDSAGTLRLIGERRLDDLGVLADPRHPRAVEALGVALRAERQWSVLDLRSWGSGLSAFEQLRDGLGIRRLSAVRTYERCPFVETTASFASLVSKKSSSFRKWLRKVERRATSHGETRLVTLQDPELRSHHLKELVLLEQTSAHWAAGTAHFADRRFIDLLLQCLELGVPLTLLRVEVDRRVVAAELLVRHRGTDFGLWTTFDRAYSHTGSWVVQEALRRACETGASRFDFLQGDERYKLDWATGVRDVHQAVVARARPGAVVRLAGLRVRWAVARRPRARAWAAAFERLRRRLLSRGAG